MKKIIRSSSHTTKFANSAKHAQLRSFLEEYDRMKWWFVDYFWHTRIEWATGRVMDIKNTKLDVPSFVSTTEIPWQSDLSSRAIKLASGEALGIVKSQVEKRRKQLYILSNKMKLGDVANTKHLQKKIDSTPLVQPTKTTIDAYASLDSNCCTYIQTKDGKFNGFLKLHAIGKKYGTFYIPINFSRHSKKLIKSGFQLLNSWNIGTDTINSRWEKEIQESTGTKILGADQGLTTCLSLSDGQVTKQNAHGYDLGSIIKTMTNKKKGSKSFKRAQEHRTNYINWSINQLNLDDVKELRLEKLYQMRKGKISSSALSHWTYTEINTQIINRCELLGVRVVEQSSVYRSQRCSDCGWTQKSNRKGKEFICKKCGTIHDADVNGALNHEADLYRLPFGIWQIQLNKAGFYWLEDGIFDVFGQEIAVPDVKNCR
jgi:transposase